MTTRTMIVQADEFAVTGAAWNGKPLELVVSEYHEGEVTRRVRIPLRPTDIQDLASRLWEIRDKYATAVADMDRALNRASINGPE